MEFHWAAEGNLLYLRQWLTEHPEKVNTYSTNSHQTLLYTAVLQSYRDYLRGSSSSSTSNNSNNTSSLSMSQGGNSTTDGAKETKEKMNGKGGHLFSQSSLSASENSNKGKVGKNSPDKVVNNNASVNNSSSTNSSANSIFHHSSHQDSYFELIQMLIEVFHADPNLRNGGTQRTALHAAAQVGNLELVRYLCERCHVKYELDLFHDSPFDLAVRSGKTACAAYLKEYMDSKKNNNYNTRDNIDKNTNVASPVPVMSSYTINLGNKGKKEMQHTTNVNNSNNNSNLLEASEQPNFSSSAGENNNSSNRNNDYNNFSETQRQEVKMNKVQSFAESSRSVMEQMKQELRLAADSCKLNEDSSPSSYGSRNSKATPRSSEPQLLLETERCSETENKTKSEDNRMQRVNSNVLTDQININKDDEISEPFMNNNNNNYNKTDMYIKRDTPLANLFSSNSDNSIEEHVLHQYEETDFVCNNTNKNNKNKNNNNNNNNSESIIENKENYPELLQQSCQVKLRKEVDISHYKFFQNVDLQSFRAHFGDGFTIMECIDHYEIRGLLPYTFKEVVYFTPVIIGVYSPVAPFPSSSSSSQHKNNKKNDKVRSDNKAEKVSQEEEKQDEEEFAYCRYRVILDLENMASFAINRRATYIDPLSGSFMMSAVDRFYSTLDNNNKLSGTKENCAAITGNNVKENKLVRFINEIVIRNFEEVAPMIAQTSINAFPSEIPINKIGSVDGKNENWNHREKNLPPGFRNVLSQPKLVLEGTASSQQKTSATSSPSSSSMVYVPRSVEMLRHYRIIQDLSRFGDGLFRFSLASPLVMDGCIPIYNKTLLKCYCSRFSPNTPVQCPEHLSLEEQQQQNLKMNEIPNGQVSGVLSSSHSMHSKTKQSLEQQEEFQESTILDVKDVSCVLMLKIKIKFYNSVTGSSGYESVPSVYLMELSDQGNAIYMNNNPSNNISSPKENYLKMWLATYVRSFVTGELNLSKFAVTQGMMNSWSSYSAFVCSSFNTNTNTNTNATTGAQFTNVNNNNNVPNGFDSGSRSSSNNENETFITLDNAWRQNGSLFALLKGIQFVLNGRIVNCAQNQVKMLAKNVKGSTNNTQNNLFGNAAGGNVKTGGKKAKFTERINNNNYNYNQTSENMQKTNLPNNSVSCSSSSNNSSTSLSPSNASKLCQVQMTNGDKCVICFTLIREIVLLPCSHCALCGICAHALLNHHRQGKFICPVCHTRVEHVCRVVKCIGNV